MTLSDALGKIHAQLFASAELAAIVNTNIHYARGPVTSQWPQVIYFDVATSTGYNIDYDTVTVQFSAWSTNKFQSLTMRTVLYNMFLRFNNADFNWTELIDSGALPQDDQQLYGQFLRFQFRYRGANI
jgi:hypothetical protein